MHHRRNINAVLSTFLHIGLAIQAGCATTPSGPNGAGYTEPLADELLIRNARLFDGTGPSARDGQSILIRGGVIAEIGAEVRASSGVRTIDASGYTVIPGLIDAHVHLYSVPGAAFRQDDPSQRRHLRRQHLRGYLANGVTTVLDTAISFDDLTEIRGWLDAGEPGPRVLALGPPLSAPGGYADATPHSYAFRFNVTGPEAVPAMLQKLKDADVVGVKVKIEPGFGATPVWPTHAVDVLGAISETAQAFDLPVYVHAFSETSQGAGLDMGAHALVHAGFWSGHPSLEHIQRVKASGTFVVSTLSILDSSRLGRNPELLDAPNIGLSVPAVELETARDPSSLRGMRKEGLRWSMPPKTTEEQLERILDKPSGSSDPLATPVAALRAFHEAGIPIVMGSDSGNWETMPYEFHGPTTVREVELLTLAGLTPAHALQSSTRVAAEMMGISDVTGTVEIGKAADLVILEVDPLADITALTRPLWVVKGGEARTPSGWMTDAGP